MENDNKPVFVDEKELANLNVSLTEEPKEDVKTISIEDMNHEVNTEVNNSSEPILVEEEEKNNIEEPQKAEIEQEVVAEEPKKEDSENEKTDIVVAKSLDITEKEKTKDKPKFKLDLKMFVTFFAGIFVAYVFFTVARGFYLGFKYYDCAHDGSGCINELNQK